MTVGWKVTVTTIYCDSVDDDVPIMVFKDGTTKCVGYKNHMEHITKGTSHILDRKGKKPDKELKCEGPECSRVIEYRERLFTEQERENK